MKTIRSRHLASAAIIALLALPAAALAQPAQSARGRPTGNRIVCDAIVSPARAWRNKSRTISNNSTHNCISHPGRAATMGSIRPGHAR